MVLLIIDFLYEDEKPPEIEDPYDDSPPYRPSSTVALALTCHAFCDHALARVWHTQFNLVNLVKCMPADAWVQNAGEVSFPRYFMPEDFTRFKYYASLIKDLRLVTDWKKGLEYLSNQCYTDLMMFLGRQWLPNLLSIYSYSEAFAFGYTPVYITSCLRSLTLHPLVNDNDDDDDEILCTVSIMAALPTLAPQLTHLSIVGPQKNSSSDISEHVIKMLQHGDLGQLQHLECELPSSCDSTKALLGQLGSLSLLKSLNIYSHRNADLDQLFGCNAFTSEDSAFLALTSVQIYVTDLDSARTAMKTFCSSPLSRIYVDLESPYDVKSIGDFFEELATRYSSLRDIKVLLAPGSDDDVSGPPGDCISMAQLTPLFRHGNLQTLELDIPCPVDLDDAAIKDIVMCCPHLRTLRLDCIDSEPYQEAAITLGVLSMLATIHKPRLELECLSLPFTVMAPLETDGDYKVVSSLKTLDVGGPSVDDPVELESYIRKICPNLTDLCLPSSKPIPEYAPLLQASVHVLQSPVRKKSRTKRFARAFFDTFSKVVHL
ncbi:hypothetical protein POSPLADRAFT_1058626 [Postia placenta MAD-698-R-SB12]|uniref:F-box domain-containing protein n=1 Tax=Postia placenta MAD-698-R-SB12 TaxID=670580 RepID=A0A1X6MW40_9APHY|nr:hypothetical protein POSPLADRAFT_1058626 [Postia placenta MAD-698-R-SB12]OSX60460.1 hypothetical protein POSPLADRAFT_1058626 [Postia placenta MAD-698-R-SB12]